MEVNSNKILIPLAIILAGALIAGNFYYVNKSKTSKESLASSQETAQKALDYINENLLPEGLTSSLIDVVEESGLYKFRLKIGEKEYPSYVTKDGKILFPEEGINLEEKLATTTPTEEPKKLTCQDIKKSDKPLLEAFVVSQCPYGLQMQRILNEIVKNIPSSAENMKVRYIGQIAGDKITSMHGDEEAQENLKQICIREEQGDKYWKYIDCHIKKGEVESCLTTAGINKAILDACLSDNSKGLKYAKEDFDLQTKYQISGSPTLVINDTLFEEFDNSTNQCLWEFGCRNAEAVKSLICCGFNQQPEFCSQKLTEEQATVGFSENYSSGSSTSGGGCE